MEIKRSIMVKCIPKEILISLFENYGVHVTNTMNYVKSIQSQYERIREPQKAVCPECKKEKLLNYNHIETNNLLCNYCFDLKWSEFTVLKHKPELAKQGPNFTDSGYYYGAISTGVKICKSYWTKKIERDKQIADAKEKFLVLEGIRNNLEFEIEQTKASIRKGAHLSNELAHLEKQQEQTIRELKRQLKLARRPNISFPIFKNNEIYCGRKGMFKFKKSDKGYSMDFVDWKLRKNKLQFELDIGNLIKYHKRCKNKVEVKENIFHCDKCGAVPKKECYINFQEHFIINCIEKEQHKIVYPKLIRRSTKSGFEYYFMFPARDLSNAAISREEMEKKMKSKNTEICCISFGIKNPMTLTIIKNNKIIGIKTFGDGTLYHKGELERMRRADISNAIGEKYAHEHPHKEKDKQLHLHKRRALIKAGRKIGFRHRRFVNYYNQKLTHDVVDFIKSMCSEPIIVFRDTKHIKGISYKGEMMRRLSRWSIEQQKVFLTYKSYLNNISVYLVPYKDCKILKCFKCGQESKEKVTTQILKLEDRFVCEHEKCKANYGFHVVDAYNLYMRIKEAKA